MVKIVNNIWGLIPPHDSCYKSTTNVTQGIMGTDSYIKNFRWWMSPSADKKIEYLNTYLQFLTQFLNCKYAGKNSDSDTFIGR